MSSVWTAGVLAAEGLLKAVHGEVAKALDPLNPADFDVLVARLGSSFEAATSQIEASTIRAALEAADVDWATLSAAQRDRSFAAIKSALDQGINRMIPASTAVLSGRRGAIFGAARRGVASRLPSRFTLSPHMALRDREAERLVRSNATNFIRDELGRRRDDLSEMSRTVVARGLENGLGRAEIAENLAAAMSGRVVRSTDYWNVVSGAYVNRARSYSQLLSYEDAGIATYTFDAVLDEVTCFAAGTRISLPCGGTTAIELIRAGDVVVSCRGIPRRVTALRIFSKRTWGTMVLGDGREIRVTPNHPILTTRGWVRAGCISVGDRVVDEASPDLWKDEAMPGLSSTVCPVEESEGVLLNTMQGAGAEVRALRSVVSGSSDLYKSRTGEILLRDVSESGVSEGNEYQGSRTSLRDVQSGVPYQPRGTSGGKVQTSLYEEVQSSPSGDQMHRLLRIVREDGVGGEGIGSLLLRLLLPEVWRRIWLGGDHTSRSRSGGGSVRAGSKDREVVGRLLGGGPICGRSRRGVLARVGEGPKEGRGEGRGASGIGIRGGAFGGGGDSSNAVGSDLLTSRLWPFPVDDLESRASTCRVSSIRWEVTAPAPAYDIEVDEDAGYLAEGVVVHNTEICRFMHGHTFSVTRARSTMDSTLALTDPDEIQTTEPWARTGRLPDGSRQLYYNQGDRRVRIADIQSSAMGTRDQRGTFTNAMSPAQLEAAGLQYPPLHGKCRSTVIADI